MKKFVPLAILFFILVALLSAFSKTNKPNIQPSTDKAVDKCCCEYPWTFTDKSTKKKKTVTCYTWVSPETCTNKYKGKNSGREKRECDPCVDSQ